MAPGRCESDEGGTVRGSRGRFSVVLGSERRGAGALLIVQRALYIPSRTTGQEVGRPPGPLPGRWKGDWVTERRVGAGGSFRRAGCSFPPTRLLVPWPLVTASPVSPVLPGATDGVE